MRLCVAWRDVLPACASVFKRCVCAKVLSGATTSALRLCARLRHVSSVRVGKGECGMERGCRCAGGAFVRAESGACACGRCRTVWAEISSERY